MMTTTDHLIPVVVVVGYVLPTVIHLGAGEILPLTAGLHISKESMYNYVMKPAVLNNVANIFIRFFTKVKKRVYWVEFTFMLYTKGTEINKNTSQHS